MLGLVPTHCSAEHRFPRCLDHRYCAKYEGEASTYLFELAFSMVEVTLMDALLRRVWFCVCVRACAYARVVGDGGAPNLMNATSCYV